MKTFKFIIDEKNTVWYRTTVEVKAETLNEAIRLTQSKDYDEIDGEWLIDTGEYIDPKENGGGSTIEIYTDLSQNPVYVNGEF